IAACRMDECLRVYSEHPELLDMMGSVNLSETDNWSGYPEHLTSVQIQAGLKASVLLQGTLQIAPYNYLEGSIYTKFPDGKERRVLIVGRKDMNRAVQGDKIAVKLHPKSQWRKAPSAALVDEDEDAVPDISKADSAAPVVPDTSRKSSSAEVTGERAHKRARVSEQDGSAAATEDSQEPVNPSDVTDNDLADEGEPTGYVVGIVRRNWRSYCAFLDPNFASRGSRASSGPVTVSVLAMDRRIPKIKIRTRQLDVLAGQRFVVAIDSWPKESRYPQGHFVRALGDAGDKATETEVLLLEHDVPFQPFTKNVLSDLPLEGSSWLFDAERDQVSCGKRQDI
ncbi:exosome catalytic subunit dis3, partial [Coemansia sp. RSA 486]